MAEPGAASGERAWRGPALMALGAGMALLPPLGDLPLAAYLSVGRLPWWVALPPCRRWSGPCAAH